MLPRSCPTTFLSEGGYLAPAKWTLEKWGFGYLRLSILYQMLLDILLHYGTYVLHYFKKYVLQSTFLEHILIPQHLCVVGKLDLECTEATSRDLYDSVPFLKKLHFISLHLHKFFLEISGAL